MDGEETGLSWGKGSGQFEKISMMSRSGVYMEMSSSSWKCRIASLKKVYLFIG